MFPQPVVSTQQNNTRRIITSDQQVISADSGCSNLIVDLGQTYSTVRLTLRQAVISNVFCNFPASQRNLEMVLSDGEIVKCEVDQNLSADQIADFFTNYNSNWGVVEMRRLTDQPSYTYCFAFEIYKNGTLIGSKLTGSGWKVLGFDIPQPPIAGTYENQHYAKRFYDLSGPKLIQILVQGFDMYASSYGRSTFTVLPNSAFGGNCQYQDWVTESNSLEFAQPRQFQQLNISFFNENFEPLQIVRGGGTLFNEPYQLPFILVFENESQWPQNPQF